LYEKGQEQAWDVYAAGADPVIALMIAVVAFIVFVKAARRIPVQYAKRVWGPE